MPIKPTRKTRAAWLKHQAELSPLLRRLQREREVLTEAIEAGEQTLKHAPARLFGAKNPKAEDDAVREQIEVLNYDKVQVLRAIRKLSLVQKANIDWKVKPDGTGTFGIYDSSTGRQLVAMLSDRQANVIVRALSGKAQ